MVPRKQTLSSVKNAAKILKAFSQATPELGITELSERLGITKSSVSRIVRTLCEEQLLQRNDETRKYRLSLLTFELGSIFFHEVKVCQLAIPMLNGMSKLFSGVFHIAVYDRGSVVFLLKMPEERQTKTFNTMGKRVPSYCVASGKAMLAFQDDSEIERVLQQELKRYTAQTITDPAALRAELANIKNAGHALSKEEYRIGITSVAVPVFDDSGRVLAAISLTGPSSDFTPVWAGSAIQEMKKYSRIITEHL